MNINVISGSEKIMGEKIRYIQYNHSNYFIYSLKEQDEDGYEKLYINKITNDVEDVIDDNEWEELKKIIPTIVKQIKSNNIIDFEDLELNKISNIDLMYSKPFKLKTNIVDSIKKQENILKIDEELQEIINGIEIDNNDSVDNLDQFLNNYEEELNKIELPMNMDIEEDKETKLVKLNEELIEEKNKNEQLNKKIEELEKQISQYKETFDRIKIMLEA